MSEPSSATPAGRVAELDTAVRRSLGIYGSAPTCHLSALARVRDFRPARFDRAVEEERSMVRVRAMRYTVHTLTHDLLRVAMAAVRGQHDKLVRRWSKYVGDHYDTISARVEQALADGPRPAAELRQEADPDGELGSHFSILLAWMAGDCRIVRATTTGGWRSNRLTYALWDDWIPEVDPFALDPEEGRRRLAERYVEAYGPVELEDLWWWSGWTKTQARAAAEEVELEARGDAAELLEGVRLLPVWDVLMVAYRQRGRLFDPDHAPFIYDSMGNATSVVLDGGRVRGIWELGSRDDPLEVAVAPLGGWSDRRWDDVEAEAHRIGAMIGADRVELTRVDAPIDLTEAQRNRFLSPLSG